jgi:hypothetical protein
MPARTEPRSSGEFQDAFPGRLQAAGPRVIKQNCGNAGQGVWKIEVSKTGDALTVLEARRGSEPFVFSLADFLDRCAPYFADGGCIVDQPFQARLPEGVCCMDPVLVAGGRMATHSKASQRDSKTIVPAPRKFADGGFQRPGFLIPDQSYPDHHHPPDL